MGQRLQVESHYTRSETSHPDEQTVSTSQVGSRTEMTGMNGSRSVSRSGGTRPNANLSLSSPSLSPVLRMAMDSLDVNLDEELERYRRSLLSQQFAEKHEPQASTPPQPVPGGGVPTPAGRGTDVLAIAPHSDTPLLTANATDGMETSPDGYLESSEALLRSLHESPPDKGALPVHPDRGQDESEPGLFASLMTPLGIGSLMLLVLSSATLGYMIMNPTLLTRGTDQNQDSSTALGHRESDPMGISPDLSAGEFSDLNLHSLSSIPSQRSSRLDASLDDTAEDSLRGSEMEGENTQSDEAVLEPSQVEPAPPSSPANSTVATAPPAPIPAPVPFSPSPQTVTPQPIPVPAPSSSPAVPSASAPSASAPSASAPSSATNPPTAPTAPVPQPIPVTSAPAPTAPASASSSTAMVASVEPPQEEYVYVVTPYTGDRSLEQAREAVSGAYVRNFPQGAQVQLGAFSTPEGARDLVQELNSQGIPAQVYSR